MSFCIEHGVYPFFPVQESTMVLFVLYLTKKEQSYKPVIPGTAEGYLQHVYSLHKVLGHGRDYLQFELLRDIIKGIKRMQVSQKRPRVLPITAAVLLRCVLSWTAQNTLDGLRWWYLSS